MYGFTDFSYGFYFNINVTGFNFLNLEEINLSNTSGVTDFSYAFRSLPALKKVTGLDTSNCTVINNAFVDCSNLTSINSLDLNKATNIRALFNNCSSLEEVNFNETLVVVNVAALFDGCSALKNINGVLNLNSVTSQSYVSGMFGSTSRPTLLEVVSIKNLGLNLDLSFAPNLTRDSLVYCINNLKTVSGKTLTLGAINLAKLTAEEIAVGTAKGWTIS